VNGYEEIQQKNEEFQNSIQDFKKISKIISLKATLQFKSAEQARENIMGVTKRTLTDDLIEFLKVNLPTKKKSSNFSLAVIDSKFGKIINKELGIQIQVGDFVLELSRAIRIHIHKFLKVSEEDLLKSMLGLGHSYSRTKCMFDVNRQDKPVIQSIALIDQLDKDINSFCMRIKEWFGWHFPELAKIVTDNAVYVRCVNLIQTRENLAVNMEELIPQIEEIVVEPEIAKQIIDGAYASMGSDFNETDLLNVKYFCEKIHRLIEYRENLLIYLREKMKKLAPNTSTLIGETVAARLISHSGSLSNLAKYPASTIQILGAEKALFRALKTRGKTPKYGLLYHSSFIGKAQAKNKGKVSRYLANKLAMSSRIDFFSEDRYDDYGIGMKNQVEDRLKFLSTGIKPKKNIDVMKGITASLLEKNNSTDEEEDEVVNKKMLKKKRKTSEMKIEDDEEVEEKPKKKKKKVRAESS